jgi:hypothetical protein
MYYNEKANLEKIWGNKYEKTMDDIRIMSRLVYWM